jgi:hypothetical protein
VSRLTDASTVRLARWALAGACAALVAVPSAAQTVRLLDWQDLRPPAVEADDPFARLPAEHLEALREIVLGRTLEARGLPPGDAALRQRAALTAQLAAAGLDADVLLAERERLMAARRAQAETPVVEIDGRTVKLVGWLVPASSTGQGVDVYLLVPWAGACSHTPPPPMNQIVRLRATPALEAAGAAPNAPVSITGALSLQPQVQPLFVADGPTTVRSAYAMQVAHARPLLPAPTENPLP